MFFSRLTQQIYPISVPKSCLGTLHTKPLCRVLSLQSLDVWDGDELLLYLSWSHPCSSRGQEPISILFYCILNQGSAVPLVLHKDTEKFKELPQILSLFSQKPEFRQISECLAHCAGLFLPLSLWLMIFSDIPLSKSSLLTVPAPHCASHTHSCFCPHPTAMGAPAQFLNPFVNFSSCQVTTHSTACLQIWDAGMD